MANNLRKQTTEERSHLERYALLIDNASDIIGVIDAETLTIDEINPAITTTLGYARDEICGRSLSVMLEPAEIEALKQGASAGSEKRPIETRVRLTDGSVRWLQWNVRENSGKWFVHARDITEVIELRAALEKSADHLESTNKELESFSYSVSHDLRAPLRAVIGNAQAMEEDFGAILDEDATRFLRKIKESGLRMERLINDLLAFSRTGRKEVRKSVVDMNALVKSMFDEVGQSQPHAAAVSIGTLPEASADLSMMKVVWRNLISNAIKFSSKKAHPQIEVGGYVRDTETAYYIRDNGAGFNMDYANKLFGTFQRLHDASEFEGVGMGLAIAQRIVLKHRGTIRAEAVPEQGATFYFSIPLGNSI